jgi:hypothetical protein
MASFAPSPCISAPCHDLTSACETPGALPCEGIWNLVSAGIYRLPQAFRLSTAFKKQGGRGLSREEFANARRVSSNAFSDRSKVLGRLSAFLGYFTVQHTSGNQRNIHCRDRHRPTPHPRAGPCALPWELKSPCSAQGFSQGGTNTSHKSRRSSTVDERQTVGSKRTTASDQLRPEVATQETGKVAVWV